MTRVVCDSQYHLILFNSMLFVIHARSHTPKFNHSGPTKQGVTQSRPNMSRTHHHTPTRFAPGPPGTLTFLIFSFLQSICICSKDLKLACSSAVAHQNGGLKNANHAANQRNSQHHGNQRPTSGNTARPFLPTNVSQLKDRGSRQAPQQTTLDFLKVPDQGAAG